MTLTLFFFKHLHVYMAWSFCLTTPVKYFLNKSYLIIFIRTCHGLCFLSFCPPRWGTADAEIKGLLVGAQGYQKFPLSKPVVEYSFACFACLQGFYLHGVCLPGSFNFVFHKFLQSSTVECVFNSESELLLVVGIHLVSP